MPRQGWLALMVSGATVGLCAQAAPSIPGSRPAEPGTALCLAESADGLQFTATDELLIAGGARPALVALPNKQLLAVFEAPPASQQHSSPGSPPSSHAQIHRGGTVDRNPSGFLASRSSDNGKTWLTARPVRLGGIPEGANLSSPSLILMPSGLVRLYFAMSEPSDRAANRDGTIICSAVTRDGVEYQVDRQVRIACEGLASPRISAFRAEKQIVLLVTCEAEPSRKKNSGSAMIQQHLSTDGRTFSKPDRARFIGQIGHVVQLDGHHWRMFITSGTGIHSRMSNDGIRWRDESGIRLQSGSDPAAAQLDKDRFIMLFASTATAETAKLPQLAANEARSTDASAEVAVKSGESVTEPQSGEAAEAKESDSAGWETFAPGGFESELGDDWTGSSGGGLTDSSLETADDLAPLPDFQTKFDYVDWFARNAIVPDEQNAYYSYVPVLEGLPAREELVNDMFNDPVPGQVPGPWKPADQPIWEESYQATQDLMAQYFQAARDPRAYSCPLIFGSESDPENRMLISMLLPSLRDMRAAAKATMAQAWRAPDGIVPPEQMRTAVETTIGNARHLQQGPSLIERLVGVAERNLAHQNARQALHQGVFQSSEDLEATLNVLRETDTADPDPGGWVRMEHAAAMDAIQYLFLPDSPNSEPKLDIDRLTQFNTMFGGRPLDDEDRAKLGQLTNVDGKADAEVLTEHYRGMLEHFRTQFPYEDAGHLEDEAIRIAKEHPVAGLLVPSLYRASDIMRRTEASRRATQLAFNVEVFKARHGRYPASLGELPPEEIQDVRTDPYSRQDFAYRLTETGPRIYSVSGNGRDDGGEHSRRWADDKQEGESDDYVFYPPQE